MKRVAVVLVAVLGLLVGLVPVYSEGSVPRIYVNDVEVIFQTRSLLRIMG